jgi:hypothetical protein
MRQAVLDLYSNQIMDNLVRAYIGLPMVQMDYTALTGTVTQEANATVGQEQVLTTERDKLGITTLRRFLNDAKFSLMGDEKLQLTITSNPVLNNNEVYNAYLEFISKPGRLMVTTDPPLKCQAHVVRCSCLGCEGKRYYWVPCEYSTDFLRLALVTTVQRGQPLATPDYFDDTVSRVQDSTPDRFDKAKKRRFTVYLKKRVPNDEGKLSVTLGSETYVLSVYPYTDKIDGEVVKRGEKIDRLWLIAAVENGKVIRREDPEGTVPAKLSPAEFQTALEGQTVRIDLNYYKPTLPTTEDLLQAIRHEVGLIRLDQASR